MRSLVVYYSRGGNTRTVAEAIAMELGADIEEIVDTKKRGGPVGFLRAIGDGRRKATTEIGEMTHDPSGYDLVIVGGPVWAGGMSPATRTYLEMHRTSLPDVAFFSTCGRSAENAFAQMEHTAGKTPKAKLEVLGKAIRSGDHVAKGFVSVLD